MYKYIFAAMTTVATVPAHAGTVYYVDLVNTAASDVVSFEVATPGSDRFHAARLGNTPLRGGGDATTIAIRKGEDGCTRDFRISFSDGRVVTHRGFNLCRYATYHTDRYLHPQVAANDKP